MFIQYNTYGKSRVKGKHLTCCGLSWIGGLCINQKDLNERAQQVLNMNKVYDIAAFLYYFYDEPPHT
jgi:hypothetical protein